MLFPVALVVLAGSAFEPGDAVVTSDQEIRSDLLPWQRRGRRGVPVRPVRCGDLAALAAAPTPELRLVAMAMASDLRGASIEAPRPMKAAHAHGVPVLIDAAQAARHDPADVGALRTTRRPFAWKRVAPIVALVLGVSRGVRADEALVPILIYHRFGAVVAAGMTVTAPVFESHLRRLRDGGYTVVPLRRLVDHLRGAAPPLPSCSVVVTADDGHRSIYTDMLPLVQRYAIPVTLFVYPSAISRAD